MLPTDFPRYDWTQTYDWNYARPPAPLEVDVTPIPGEWSFLGLPVDSPLGIPAGPLLNGGWCLYYASLGFDVLTYKTVRSRARACYPMPNLQPVDRAELSDSGQVVEAEPSMHGSWAVSFGMPSKEPAVWRSDIEATRNALPRGKILAVSVVGSMQESWGIEQLADDYALCAKWAVESGADVVEANFSCPNVSTCDGQLYQAPDDAALVAHRIREAIPATPFVIKIGHLADESEVLAFTDAISPVTDGLAMTNSIAAKVRAPEGEWMFSGEPRGICGSAILAESVRQVARFSQLLRQQQTELELVAVGGVGNADDLLRYCHAGAAAVHIATAAMERPEVGIEIRQALSQQEFTRSSGSRS